MLFATETFSTGLNMPARTVCFAGIRKFDGASFRNLSGGEYIQMSGRAGRRGLDASGTVILLCDQKLEPAVAKDIVRGRPDPLHSAFRLTYPSLLSVLRLDEAQITPEMLISRSLRQFQMRRQLPELRARLTAATAAAEAVVVDGGRDAEDLAQLLEERGEIATAMAAIEAQPQHAVPFLQPGRLLRLASYPSQSVDTDAPAHVPTGNVEGVWAAVLSFERLSKAAKAPAAGGGQLAADADEALSAAYIVDVIARVRPEAPTAAHGMPRQLVEHDDVAAGKPVVVAVPLTQVVALGAPRIILPTAVLTQEARCAYPHVCMMCHTPCVVIVPRRQSVGGDGKSQ